MSAKLVHRPPAQDPVGVVRLPLTASTWKGFREWYKSDRAPQRGQCSFLGDEVYIDMSPQRLGSHAALKGAIYEVLGPLIKGEKIGFFFPDQTMLSHEVAGISNEPDAMFVSHATLAGRRVTLVPTADGADFGEITGTPDLVVEAVSPSSVGKDANQLRVRYHAAGIPEYWLIDATEVEIDFQLLRHTPGGYEAVAVSDGWVRSVVLGREFRISRDQHPSGLWEYTLHVRQPGAA